MIRRTILATIAVLLQTTVLQAIDLCAIHFDKSFYVTGEVAWFRIYLPQSLEYDQSLIQVHLVDPSDNLVETLYFSVDEHTGGSGYFKIPYDWLSGMYYFVVTAQKEETNQYTELLRHQVPIYSDLNQRPVDFDSAAKGSRAWFPSLSDQLNIHIETVEPIYKVRDKVKVRIKVTDRNGSPVKAVLSVAVRDQELSQALSWPSYGKRSFEGSGFKVENDLTITGKVTDITSEQGLNFGYLAAVFPQQGSAKLFNSDQNGSFTMDFPVADGPQQIQLIDYRNTDIAASLLPPIDFKSEDYRPQLVYEQSIKDYLELSRRQKKVAQVFDQIATQVSSTDSRESSRKVPDKRIVMSDYEPFEDLAELFKDLFTHLKLKKKKSGDFEVKMVNPDNKPFYPGTPIFMIDGFVTRDTKFAATFDINNIEQIDLYFRYQKLTKYFGSLGRSGVVMITTKDKAALLPEKDGRNIFYVKGKSPAREFPDLKIIANSDSEHTPYFRPVVYWNPVIETNEQGEAVIEFIQSDDRSTFEVEVVGRDGSGDFSSGNYSYLVE